MRRTLIAHRQFAVVTGASAGIGYDLAKQCIAGGFDVLICADSGSQQAAEHLGGTTKVGQAKKDDPAMVAQIGLEAMLAGKGDVVAGWHNKLQAAIAHVAPADLPAEMHRKMAEPKSHAA